MEQLIIQLISGAIGGNVAGALLKQFNMGVIVNSIAGIVGGGIGGQILSNVLGIGAGGGMDISSIVTQVAGGGVGGAIVLVIIGVIKKALGK